MPYILASTRYSDTYRLLKNVHADQVTGLHWPELSITFLICVCRAARQVGDENAQTRA